MTAGRGAWEGGERAALEIWIGGCLGCTRARRPKRRALRRGTAITLPRRGAANQRARRRCSPRARPDCDWRSRPPITAFAGSSRSLDSGGPPSLYRQYAGRAAIRQLLLRSAHLHRADSCRTACSPPNGAAPGAWTLSALRIDGQSLLHTPDCRPPPLRR